jgi:hypothetical protein
MLDIYLEQDQINQREIKQMEPILGAKIENFFKSEIFENIFCKKLIQKNLGWLSSFIIGL